MIKPIDPDAQALINIYRSMPLQPSMVPPERAAARKKREIRDAMAEVEYAMERLQKLLDDE